MGGGAVAVREGYNNNLTLGERRQISGGIRCPWRSLPIYGQHNV